jgi:hypothetical protein
MLQQGSIAEHCNCTLEEHVIAMLNSARLPICFWGKALYTYGCLLNKTPSSAIPPNTMPYKMVHKRKPDYLMLRVFGCCAWAHVHCKKQKSLEPHAKPCMFLGVLDNFKGWKLWDPSAQGGHGSVIVSWDVIWNKEEFPGLLKDTHNPIPAHFGCINAKTPAAAKPSMPASKESTEDSDEQEGRTLPLPAPIPLDDNSTDEPPCLHCPVCPLTLGRLCHLLHTRHCSLPLHRRCQTRHNRLSASLRRAWLACAFLSSCHCLKRSLRPHVAVDKAQLASHQICAFLQHSTCKKAALCPWVLPCTARRVPACSLQRRHLLLQVASPRQPHLSPQHHPLLRRRQTLLLLGPHKPPMRLTTSLTSSRPMPLVWFNTGWASALCLCKAWRQSMLDMCYGQLGVSCGTLTCLCDCNCCSSTRNTQPNTTLKCTTVM